MGQLDAGLAFYLQMTAWAALGAFALWLRLRYGGSLLGGLDEFWDEIIDDFHWRVLLKFAFFVGFGAIVSILLVGPMEGRQAFAAGMAWPSLLGPVTKARKKKGTTGGKAA
jgi:hypothetical protein